MPGIYGKLSVQSAKSIKGDLKFGNVSAPQVGSSYAVSEKRIAAYEKIRALIANTATGMARRVNDIDAFFSQC